MKRNLMAMALAHLAEQGIQINMSADQAAAVRAIPNLAETSPQAIAAYLSEIRAYKPTSDSRRGHLRRAIANAANALA